jgi:hypothetical protein
VVSVAAREWRVGELREINDGFLIAWSVSDGLEFWSLDFSFGAIVSIADHASSSEIKPVNKLDIMSDVKMWFFSLDISSQFSNTKTQN